MFEQKWGVLPGQEFGPPRSLSEGGMGTTAPAVSRIGTGQSEARGREEQGAEVLTLTQAGEGERREEAGLLGGAGSGRCCVTRATHEHREAPFHELLCLSLQIFKVGILQMGKLRLREVRSLAHVTTARCWICLALQSGLPTVTATFLSYLQGCE